MTDLHLAVRDFFALLDYTEESDSGRVFHPVTIGCCRVMMTPKLEDTLRRMKAGLRDTEVFLGDNQLAIDRGRHHVYLYYWSRSEVQWLSRYEFMTRSEAWWFW